MIRIAITGPESTGKSELAESLARHYQTFWVPEFARDYIAGLNRPYFYDDILVIARKQVQSIQNAVNKSNLFLFVDTELIVCKIWCEFRFGKCHPWILKSLEKQDFDLYLLMDIDLPWQPDPQREHPDKRDKLFQLYLTELNDRHFPYEIVRGIGNERLGNAIGYIQKYLKTNI